MENIFGNIKTFKDVEVFAGDDVTVAANANIRNLNYENLEESQEFRTFLQLKGIPISHCCCSPGFTFV